MFTNVTGVQLQLLRCVMAPISLDAWLLHQLTFPDRVALFQTGVDPNSVFWALEFTTNHKIFWILPACTVQRHALQYKLKQRTMESWRLPGIKPMTHHLGHQY